MILPSWPWHGPRVNIVVLSPGLESTVLQSLGHRGQCAEEVLEQEAIHPIELREVIAVDVGGEVRVGDMTARVTHLLCELLGGIGEVEGDELDSRIRDCCLQGGSGADDYTRPFGRGGVLHEVL